MSPAGLTVTGRLNMQLTCREKEKQETRGKRPISISALEYTPALSILYSKPRNSFLIVLKLVGLSLNTEKYLGYYLASLSDFI